MARLEPMGVEAVIKGLPGFLKGMGQMGDATSRTSGLLGKIGGIASAGFKTLAVGAGAAVGAIGAVSGAMLKLASDAAPIAGVRDAFVGLTSDIEGGSTAMLSALQDASAGMTTNVDLMKSFNLAAQLIGKDFAVALPDAMQYLGKVAAATGEDMGYMMDSLVRGVGRLSPMILDNLGIQVDLTEAYEIWAKQNDRTVDSMSKTEQQTAVMAQVMSKLAENTADMPDVTGSAQQAFASFGVTMQNLKDEIGLALLPVITPLIQRLGELAKVALPLVVKWIEERFVPAVKRIVEWFGGRIPDAIGKFKGFWIGVLQPAFQAISAFINDNLIPVFQAVASWLGENIPKAIEVLRGFWESTLQPALENVRNAIIENIIPAIQNLFSAFQEHAPAAQEAFQGFMTWVQNNIVPIFEGIVPKIESIMVSLTVIIGKALDTIADWWREHGVTVMDYVTILWKIVTTTIANTVNLILSVVDAFLKVLQGDWEGAWNAIKDFLITLLESALSIVGVSLDEFVGSWTGIWENVKVIFNHIWDSIVNGLKDKIEAVKKTITGGLDSIIGGAKKKLGIKSPSKVFTQYGQDIMAGLAQGIQSALNMPELALTKAVTNLVQPVGQVQAPASISRASVTNNQYQGDNLNLNIHTRAPAEDIVADFRMLKAMGSRI